MVRFAEQINQKGGHERILIKRKTFPLNFYIKGSTWNSSHYRIYITEFANRDYVVNSVVVS